MDFVKAHDLAEALAELAERGDELTVLAGGTDVMVQILRGDLAPPGLLYIRVIQELRGITADDRTWLGALTTHRELLTHPHVQSEHPGLAEAAATIGGRQTQNMGTIAGNVVNASPAADLLPPLLVADAVVNIESAKGGRELALTDFVLDRKLTARAPGELVTGISLARPELLTGEVYLKLGRRKAMEVAVVGLAVRLSFATDGTVLDARVAACSVAPTAFRATEAEGVLIGTKLESDAVAEAGGLLRCSASPINDARATAAYRQRVLAPLLEQAVDTCRARAGL